MKIKVFKDDLLEGCQTVQNIISPHTTLPILSNILIAGLKDKIKLTATDLDIGISCSLPAEVKNKGAITVPAKKFSDIIRELTLEDVEINTKKNNSTNITSGKSEFKLMGISKDEFPELPDFKNKEFITLSQGSFKRMLEKSVFAISKDETRYTLSGALIEIKEDSVRVVTTDGRRLALIEQKQDLPQKIDKKVIIPSKTVQELIRDLADVEDELKVVFGDNQICFEFNKTIITSRLIEGKFPDYEQIIPKEAKEKVKVKRDDLYKSIKRVSLFTNPDSQAIKMDFLKDKMVLSKNAPELGEAKDELRTEYKGNTISIGFNPVYFLDFLKVYENEEVDIELTDPQKPAVIRTKKPYKYMYIVLPMQIT